ncbi:MAG: DotC protein [Gammaproteobacteria bacterium]|jgi:defect-in-organelle-trafficking protein DotC|nr:DotC protein [Gammaproteobacteria bacterium]
MFQLDAKIRLIGSLFFCLLLTACASEPPPRLSTANVDTTSLEELQHLATRTLPEANGINPLRLQALQQAALEVGAQGGLAKRADEINQNLKKEARQLDQAFNFHPMVLHNNVLPPVLVEGRTILDQHSPDSVRIADHTYKIVKQAHFTTATPTWHSYLWMDYKKPPPPDPSLLPKSEEEEAVWQTYVLKGWNEGIDQANTIFNTNLARLKEEYAGMTLYRKLLAQHMISEPFVATTQLGITGDSNEININDQVLRITALPELQTDSGKWQAAVIDPANDPQKWRQTKTP